AVALFAGSPEAVSVFAAFVRRSRINDVGRGLYVASRLPAHDRDGPAVLLERWRIGGGLAARIILPSLTPEACFSQRVGHPGITRTTGPVEILRMTVGFVAVDVGDAPHFRIATSETAVF